MKITGKEPIAELLRLSNIAQTNDKDKLKISLVIIDRLVITQSTLLRYMSRELGQDATVELMSELNTGGFSEETNEN